MQDFICIIFIILIISLILYSFFKLPVQEALSIKDINNAIDKVSNFGKDISKLSGDLSKEIKNVGNLGNPSMTSRPIYLSVISSDAEIVRYALILQA